MTLTEFIKEFNNKAIDYDNISGVQCIDTIKMYVHYVLGIEPQIIGDAHEYTDRYYELPYLYENFEFIPYSTGSIPQRGDLVVWDTSIGEHGHIAIGIGGATDEFAVYEQNGVVKKLTGRIYYTYNGVSGFLRPREQYKI